MGPVVQQISASQLPSRQTRSVKDWLINALGVAASVFVPAIGQTVLQAWTMNQIALTMEAVNNLANETAYALRRQELLIELNSQTILEIQKEIDEIGQEIDNLWNVATQLCDQRWLFARLCVTPARTNLTGTTKKVTHWLQNTYLPTFKNISAEVFGAIDRMDNIRLKPVTYDLDSLGTVLKSLWDRVTSWFSWPNLTTWVLIAVAILVGLVVIKCLLDRLMQTQQQVRLTALAAMQLTEQGPTGGPAAAHLLRLAEHQI